MVVKRRKPSASSPAKWLGMRMVTVPVSVVKATTTLVEDVDHVDIEVGGIADEVHWLHGADDTVVMLLTTETNRIWHGQCPPT